MDHFKLLSRSSKLSRSGKQNVTTPSSGQNAEPQLFSQRKDAGSARQPSRKRKRGQDAIDDLDTSEASVAFFGDKIYQDGKANAQIKAHASPPGVDVQEDNLSSGVVLPFTERERILKQHKLKVTWLRPPRVSKKQDWKTKGGGEEATKNKHLLFPSPVLAFEDLESNYGISHSLVSNVVDQGFITSTEVQLAALPLLLDSTSILTSEIEQPASRSFENGINLLTVAPTGSGKTLAFMIPLLHSLPQRKRKRSEQCVSAIILAPTKELAGQIVNEGRKLVKNTGLRISQARKRMRFVADDVLVQEEDKDESSGDSIVKSDIIVSTPGVLQSVIAAYRGSKLLCRVHSLVLDEADVLLDPLFRDQTVEIWNSLTNPDLRVSMWSATMGSNIENLTMNTINERRKRLITETDVSILEVPLVRLVVGLKDSAVPNVQHKLVYAATEQGKLVGLRQLLHPATSSVESGPPLRPPFLVFTQTIERAVALHAELKYDIPAEAGGLDRIAVIHADLSDMARDKIMTRFRKGEIWIMVTTDLLSRGVDFRGINGVVNYDMPTSSAAYVHRVGRTGRAGREGGVAVTLYSKEDIPYLKHVVNIVMMAQKHTADQSDLKQWLLDTIPSLSKNEKHNLKIRGIESRTAGGQRKDPKAARKVRISSKAGYVRREENRRKGAILGSQRRAQADNSDDEEGDETDFGGFD